MILRNCLLLDFEEEENFQEGDGPSTKIFKREETPKGVVFFQTLKILELKDSKLYKKVIIL